MSDMADRDEGKMASGVADSGSAADIGRYAVVREGAQVGVQSDIGPLCFVDADVQIGRRVRVSAGAYLGAGLSVQDEVLIGPNATFVAAGAAGASQTLVCRGACIGAGATILSGITLGRGAVVEAGAVVTQSVPPYAIVAGSPAKVIGYVENNSQVKLTEQDSERVFPVSETGSQAVGVGGAQLHRLKLVKDIRGDLTVGEFGREIPFVAQRYFIVFNVPSEKNRGEHAHRECEQFLICVRGSCAVVLDDGSSRREVVLDSPSLGLYIPPLVWSIQYKHSSDAVLLVYASHYYEASDYIRDYSEFVHVIGQDAKVVPETDL